MSPEQLAEIEARLRAATLVAPKPWSVDQPREDDFARDVKDRDGTEICAMENNYSEDDETIAVFIANAPADIAALLAALARANKECAEVRIALSSETKRACALEEVIVQNCPDHEQIFADFRKTVWGKR